MMNTKKALCVLLLLGATGGLSASAYASGYIYHVDPPQIPTEDLSSHWGPRYIKLLSTQVERDLEWLERFKADNNIKGDTIIVPTANAHLLLAYAIRAYGFTTLATFGEPGVTMGGTTRENLIDKSKAIIQALSKSHLVSGGTTASGKAWGNMWQSARVTGVMSVAAWLIWDHLDEQTKRGVAHVLAHEADRFNDLPPWGNIFNDTKAEENAWHSMSIAAAYCMLKKHPNRQIWGQRAKQYMLSAFATQADIASGKVIDGKPINEWITRPNVHPDYTLENHNQVHPDYMSSYYLNVCNAIPYRLAAEPLPESTYFNTDKIYEVLTFLSLPDGNHFYPASTDWAARRLDSPLLATISNPFMATPLGLTYEKRILDSMEAIANGKRKLPLDGWTPGIDKGKFGSFGTTWALAFNYLCRRFYGVKGELLPEDQLEKQLAGVRVFEPGKMIVHRRADTISSYSWFPNKIMALTVPLDKDVMCYPNLYSYVGLVKQVDAQRLSSDVRWHKLQTWDDAFAVIEKVDWEWDKVRQNLCFVSLPDGTTVYFERMFAMQDIEIDWLRGGTVRIYDDASWPMQKKPRKFFGQAGKLQPSNRIFKGNWVNVDDRLGYVLKGRNTFRMYRVKPALRKGRAHYGSVELMFSHLPAGPNGKIIPKKFQAGERITEYALVTCPNWTRQATAALAQSFQDNCWLANDNGLLAIDTGRYVVYVNFSAQEKRFTHKGQTISVEPLTAGWNKSN